MSSNEFASHIHVGNARQNGPIAFGLPVGTPKDGVWAISAEHVANLLAGQLYVNIHTDVYVSGEIRGNIVANQVPVSPTTWGRLKTKYQAR